MFRTTSPWSIVTRDRDSVGMMPRSRRRSFSITIRKFSCYLIDLPTFDKSEKEVNNSEISRDGNEGNEETLNWRELRKLVS